MSDIESNERPESQARPWRERLRDLRTRARGPLLFVAGVGAALLALLLYSALFPGPQPLTQRQVNDTIAQAMASATPPPPYSVGVNQVIRPSLVLVQTERPGAKEDERNGLGSGVVINDQGDILTSLHVVADAEDIQLTFADGTQTSAFIVNELPESDIAVLRPMQMPGLLVPAILGNPGGLRIGDEAYVVANPLGLYGSMSSGVISGLNRTFEPKDSDLKMENLIQIDAAVNPGSSGGPLLNRYGQVVGIVTALVNPTGQDAFSGIGFAVPINVAGGGAGLLPY